MHKNGVTATLLMLIILVLITGSAAMASEKNSAGGNPAIHLKAGSFIPGESPLAIDSQLSAAPGASNEPAYYIVQFKDKVQESWKEDIINAGGEILEYIPDFAFKVFMTPAQASSVEQQQEIVWVGIFHPAYKLDPALISTEARLLKLRPESNADLNDVAQSIVEEGASIARQDGRNFIVLAEHDGFVSLAQIEGIAWIEPFEFYETHNEYGAGVVLGANTANANGYDGSTQIAAVADTGLGGGTSATAHADLPAGRITGIQNFSALDVLNCYDVIPDGAKDVDLGHGTHVALSVVGDGGPSGEGRSAASAANIVFQAIQEYVNFYGSCSANVDKYYLVGIPADLNNLFQPAFAEGARIHANSWGSNANGDYTSDSADVDTFMWNNPDMLVTFSAGNKGKDNNTDGVVDNDSIGSPATAKNALTVGASEGDRAGHFECDTSLAYVSHDAYQSGETCTSMSGNNVNALGTAGSRWGFAAEPLFSDVTAGNREQMAPFSSRGPTDDGRIKPDVVAPGTWVLSGYSDLYQEEYDASPNPQNGKYQVDGYGIPYSAQYKYFGGTSMSNPLAAGAATVVRDYYQKAHAHSASAALVKATLINSAVDLLDENNDGADDNDYPIPNNHEGWGLVRLDKATDDSHQFIDNLGGVSTGATEIYEFDMLGSAPLKISLVWSDYPSSAAVALNLVNDLNLTVRGPGGTPHYIGNIFFSGWSAAGGSYDSLNNVENVYVQSPAAGTWTIEVSGANVPHGPQPFALVVDGDFGGGEIIYVSSESSGLVDGLRFKDEDIIAYDTSTGTWSMYFDGSDVGFYASSRLDVDAFHIRDDGSLLLSVSGDTTLAGLGDVDDSDILLFIPTSIGTKTAGTIERYFDGSEFELTTISEDLNALTSLSNNDLIFSTSGRVFAGDFRAADEDLIRFSGAAAPSIRCSEPAQDAFVHSNYPTTSFGTRTDIRVKNAVADLNTYLKFDVQGASGAVQTATLKLYVVDGGPDGGTAYKVNDNSWDEAVITWNNAPAMGQALGGFGQVNTGDWVEIDVTAAVTGNGLVSIGISGNATDLVKYGSKEGSNAPQLCILFQDDSLPSPVAGFLPVPIARTMPVDIVGEMVQTPFTPTRLGTETSGEYAIYFDGSDVGLSNLSTEDIWGTWIDEMSGNIYFTTSLTFGVAGASGDGADIIQCIPSSLGSNTNCTFSLYWDGSAHGMAGERLDAIHIAR